MKKSNDEKRLNSLLKATIIGYYEDIDSDNELDLYDKMFQKLVIGELDDVFLCPLLERKKERKEVFELSRKYLSLCFLQGNYEYWSDSIEGVGVIDTELLCMRILSNYNFLLEVAYQNKEESLQELMLLSKSSMSKKSSVIDYLRNTFLDDELLKKVLFDVSKSDSFYKNLDLRIKEALMSYPEGTLYHTDDGNSVIADEEFLLNQVKEYYHNSIIRDVNNISELVEKIPVQEFVRVIRDIALDYSGVLEDKNHKKI